MVWNNNYKFWHDVRVILEFKGDIESFRGNNPLLTAQNALNKSFPRFNDLNDTQVGDHVLHDRMFYKNDKIIGIEMTLMKLCDSYYTENFPLCSIAKYHNHNEDMKEFYVSMPVSGLIPEDPASLVHKQLFLGTSGFLKRIFVSFRSEARNRVYADISQPMRCLFCISHDLKVDKNHSQIESITHKSPRKKLIHFDIQFFHPKIPINTDQDSGKISITTVIDISGRKFNKKKKTIHTFSSQGHSDSSGQENGVESRKKESEKPFHEGVEDQIGRRDTPRAIHKKRKILDQDAKDIQTTQMNHKCKQKETTRRQTHPNHEKIKRPEGKKTKKAHMSKFHDNEALCDIELIKSGKKPKDRQNSECQNKKNKGSSSETNCRLDQIPHDIESVDTRVWRWLENNEIHNPSITPDLKHLGPLAMTIDKKLQGQESN